MPGPGGHDPASGTMPALRQFSEFPACGMSVSRLAACAASGAASAEALSLEVTPASEWFGRRVRLSHLTMIVLCVVVRVSEKARRLSPRLAAIGQAWTVARGSDRGLRRSERRMGVQVRQSPATWRTSVTVPLPLLPLP